MRPEYSSEVKFEIGHVLFIDIVEYSKLLITQQSEQLEALKRIVRGTEQFRAAEAEGKFLRLPTGDGGALVFRTNPEAPVLCALEISRELKKHAELRVRMGIHSGPVNEITDLNEQVNIAGAGINIAQRVMDCGDAGHILLSKHVAEDLEHYPRWQPYLHDLGECEVKHGVRVSVVNLYTDDAGNSALPTRLAAQKRSFATGKRVAGFRTLVLAAGILIGLGVPAMIFTPAIVKSLRSSTSGDKASSSSVPEKSIAVLPFENLSEDKNNAYFADGIQEEILTRLSKIADLKVISRTSTQRFKSTPSDLHEIARQLSVAHILEGSAQRFADQVRVNVQLINATTDAHLWAETYDRKLTDIFAVESEIATKIADALQSKITGAEQRALTARPTENSEAHELYLRGLYFSRNRTEHDLTAAIDYFNQAIAKDPNYAPAYAEIAACYVLLAQWTPADPVQAFRKARETANRALQLDDTLAEAHAALALVLFNDELDLRDARREFERAIQINPNYASARHWFGHAVLGPVGEHDRAISELRRAVELDPFSPIINANLGYSYILARRYSEAIRQLRKAVELDPKFFYSHGCLGQAFFFNGQIDEAIAEYERTQELNHSVGGLAFQVYAYATKGDRIRALQLLEQMKSPRPRNPVWAYGLAIAHTGLGDQNAAINWLERSYASEEADNIVRIRVDPFLDPLRGDPRFAALAEKIVPAAEFNASAR
jgi:TolB-like protein/Tfp pilus assembly protein PilF/class 3 adenylate cyclase